MPGRAVSCSPVCRQALRKQLESIADSGVYALTIPKAPYRCPPGPYERINLVASCFKTAKPKSKIIVLDANPDILSKKGLFTAARNELYPGIVDYRRGGLCTGMGNQRLGRRHALIFKEAIA